MTHFMAYVVLLSAGIAMSAAAVELVMRPRRVPTRWIWLAALVAVVGVIAFATFVPLASSLTVAQQQETRGTVGAGVPLPMIERSVAAPALIELADVALPIAWISVTTLLVLAIAYGQRRLAGERQRSKPHRLNGQAVLVTENLGPAVAGIRRPVVLVPRWVLALDQRAQELLLAHEFEHVKRGDTRLLLAGAVAAAVMPWNPVVWWMTRRLRLAVEQDCDARVLTAHPDIRRYADLLLTAASRHGLTARLLAAHFGEHRSDLGRRIQAMTDSTTKWPRLVLATAAAGILVLASCEAPRPEPLSPVQPKSGEPSIADVSKPFAEYQVESKVKMEENSPAPKYPEILRQAGVEGEVLVSFVVDETGAADPATFKVIRSTHELFGTAVKAALPSMRFVPAQIGGKNVKQFVQQPFTFTLPGTGERTAESETEVVLAMPLDSSKAAEGKKLAFTIERPVRGDVLYRASKSDSTEPKKLAFRVDRSAPEVVIRRDQSLREVPANEMPNVLVRSKSGEELKRFVADPTKMYNKTPLNDLNPDDISAIEVIKARNCSVTLGVPCPAIIVTIKAGREAAYRRK